MSPRTGGVYFKITKAFQGNAEVLLCVLSGINKNISELHSMFILMASLWKRLRFLRGDVCAFQFDNNRLPVPNNDMKMLFSCCVVAIIYTMSSFPLRADVARKSE